MSLTQTFIGKTENVRRNFKNYLEIFEKTFFTFMEVLTILFSASPLVWMWKQHKVTKIIKSLEYLSFKSNLYMGKGNMEIPEMTQYKNKIETKTRNLVNNFIKLQTAHFDFQK